MLAREFILARNFFYGFYSFWSKFVIVREWECFFYWFDSIWSIWDLLVLSIWDLLARVFYEFVCFFSYSLGTHFSCSLGIHPTTLLMTAFTGQSFGEHPSISTIMLLNVLFLRCKFLVFRIVQLGFWLVKIEEKFCFIIYFSNFFYFCLFFCLI